MLAFLRRLGRRYYLRRKNFYWVKDGVKLRPFLTPTMQWVTQLYHAYQNQALPVSGGMADQNPRLFLAFEELARQDEKLRG